MTKLRYANTTAARMLTDGLRSAALERGLSLREIGRRLGYKQPVVLSHMAKGRVPVPIDRAPEIARQVGVPVDRFLEAVLRQHHPEVEWELITEPSAILYGEMEHIAGKSLDELDAGHQRVLKEAVEERDPEARWLSAAEVPVIQLVRELFPAVSAEGLSASDREFLRTIADLLRDTDEKARR
jgi:transcriptional regulator with XRE-family HTH domain